MTVLDEMIALARSARAKAYAPYSGFLVGCCIRGESGRLHAGANVENAAYPLGQCAEASAIGQMIAAGDRRIAELVLVAEGDQLCTPCGGCRQRLAEFSRPDTAVYVADPDGNSRGFRLGDLLPAAFALEPKT